MPEWMICVDGVVETRRLMGLDPQGAALDWAATRGPQGNAAGELKVLVAKAGTVTDMTDPFEPVYKVDLRWVPVDSGGGSRWALAGISGGAEGLDVEFDLGVGDDQEPDGRWWDLAVDGEVVSSPIKAVGPRMAALYWARSAKPQGTPDAMLQVIVGEVGVVGDVRDVEESTTAVDLLWVKDAQGTGWEWEVGPEVYGLSRQEPVPDRGQILDRVAAELEESEWTAVRSGMILTVRAVDAIRPPCIFTLQLKDGPFEKGNRVGLFDHRLPCRTAGVVEAVRWPDHIEVRLVEGDMEGMVVVVSPTSLELMDS